MSLVLSIGVRSAAAFLTACCVAANATDARADWNADEPETRWNWYYAAFYSPQIGSKVMVRFGTADVELTDSNVHVLFFEPDYPEAEATFAGRVEGDGSVDGDLRGFFPEWDADRFFGTLRTAERANCRSREIVLKPDGPSGAIIVLSRIDGACD